MGKHLCNGSIPTLMATNVCTDFTGQVDSYVAISIRAAAGQPMIVGNSKRPIEHGLLSKRGGKNAAGLMPKHHWSTSTPHLR